VRSPAGSRRADLRAQPPAAASLSGELPVGDVRDRRDRHCDGSGEGGGRRLFGILPSRIELEIVRVIDTPQATHIRYRVRR
jgi:hypothetical protein